VRNVVKDLTAEISEKVPLTVARARVCGSLTCCMRRWCPTGARRVGEISAGEQVMVCRCSASGMTPVLRSSCWTSGTGPTGRSTTEAPHGTQSTVRFCNSLIVPIRRAQRSSVHPCLRRAGDGDDHIVTSAPRERHARRAPDSAGSARNTTLTPPGT
jgi:hypothetical protein